MASQALAAPSSRDVDQERCADHMRAGLLEALYGIDLAIDRLRAVGDDIGPDLLRRHREVVMRAIDAGTAYFVNAGADGDPHTRALARGDAF